MKFGQWMGQNSPGAYITSVDISESSVAEAKRRVEEAGCTNVVFRQGDIFDLPFGDEQFDHIFPCFVLEHLSNSIEAFNCRRKFLKNGGTVTII